LKRLKSKLGLFNPENFVEDPFVGASADLAKYVKGLPAEIKRIELKLIGYDQVSIESEGYDPDSNPIEFQRLWSRPDRLRPGPKPLDNREFKEIVGRYPNWENNTSGSGKLWLGSATGNLIHGS